MAESLMVDVSKEQMEDGRWILTIEVYVNKGVLPGIYETEKDLLTYNIEADLEPQIKYLDWS